ncbi:MAG: hypothetical protein HOC70_03590 [Gammaproteobacteria bacterium]|nr:hypothetical protein [Gammaproteobacteria bacterium]MBT4492301.1 hypothetical protein [Gammaproteobacteria bacterium]MBT7369677.1 hypothetical protein [Gammaproteobacteria bacterium]
MKRFLSRLIKKPDDDTFVTFVQVAMEDQKIRDQMLSVLAMQHPERLQKLRAWQEELRADNAPAQLTEILHYLEDEPRANQTLLILQKTALKSKD